MNYMLSSSPQRYNEDNSSNHFNNSNNNSIDESNMTQQQHNFCNANFPIATTFYENSRFQTLATFCQNILRLNKVELERAKKFRA